MTKQQTAPSPQESTELTRRDALVPEVITNPAEFDQNIRQWKQLDFHILCPVMHLSHIPESHRIVTARVLINPDPEGGEVYFNPLFCKRGEVALTKVGLSKIAQAAGLTLVPKRVDDRRIQFYWDYEATATWLGFDGMPQSFTTSKEWDLRDGSLRLKGFTPNQIEQARANGQANAESRAINRVVRQYGIRQKYTQQELQRPFVAVRMQWVPDMNNPAIAGAVAQARLGAVSTLYPQQQLPAGPPIDVASTPVEQRPVQTHTVPKDDPEEDRELPFATEEPARQQAKPEPLYRLTGVWQKADDAGKPIDGYYTRTEETGQEMLHIGSRAMAMALRKAFEANRPIGMEFERRGNERHVLEITDGGR